MGFSIRDGRRRPPILLRALRSSRSTLTSQSGQGTVEYILVLVVVVAIILGGLYQLNTAFKSWANNYFGDYLSCLLETGELPSIGGSAGDSGICSQLFKAFTFSDGRPLKSATNQESGDSGGGPSGAQRERASGPSGGNYIPARYGDGRFGGRSQSSAENQGRGSEKGTQINTGNTGISSSDGGYTYSQRPQAKARTRLDNKFALRDEKEERQKRTPVAAKKTSEDLGAARPPLRLKDTSTIRKPAEAADTPFTIGNFIRIIIIAAIIIALVMFLGGQALSITKSME